LVLFVTRWPASRLQAINIHGRQHNVTGYADNFTAQELGNRLERTLLVVKPDAVAKLSEILSAVASTGAL